MATQPDPKGYYSILGLEPGASDDAIKKAFRTRAMELHPDRNSAPNATAQFQLLNEAYNVLKDQESRARYDAQSYERHEERQKSSAPPEPAACIVCKRQSGQLRYAVFRSVVGVIYVCQTSFVQGIFCPDCAIKIAVKNSLKTWLIGWWSIPSFIYAPWALLVNMFGGHQPPLNNARLLGYQAWCYAVLGKTQLARAIARDGLFFASEVAKSGSAEERQEGESLLGGFGEILKHLNDGNPTPNFVKKWGFGSRMFAIQAGGACAIVMAIAIWIGATSSENAGANSSAPKGVPSSYVYQPPAAPLPPLFNEPAHALPATGILREYFDPTSQYALGPMQFDTEVGGPNYYLKIVDWTTGQSVLTGFIRSGQTLSVHVPIGTYRIKMAAGDTWYGSKYRFGPSTAYSQAADSFDIHIEGNQIAGYRVTLYKQVNGNLQVNDISPNDF